MGFHKHGIYSFRVNVQRMMVIGGHNFVADITALRRVVFVMKDGSRLVNKVRN